MARYATPLRYPGGKQRLAPFVREILKCNDLLGGHYAEPYAGGAGIAIALLLDDQVSHVHLNDSSLHIYSLWQAIVTQPDRFCTSISTASLSVQDWRQHREVVRHPEDHDPFSLGFSTFYLNRCNRSGVLTAGVIGGLAQTGKWRIDARFPRNELIRRVEAIATRADRVRVTNLDAEEFLYQDAPQHLPINDTLVYFDPPYYERAQRLYMDWYQKDDHHRLARVIQTTVAHRWIVSYDAHADVLALYDARRRFLYDLPYSAIRAYQGREVFIFSDDLEIPASSEVATVATGLKELA